VLADPGFRLFFAGETISALGSQVAPLAVTFAVLDLTRSASALGLVLGARTLGLTVCVVVGGAVADRYGRRRVMIASDILNAATQATLAVLLLSGVARLWEVIALQAAQGAANAFFRPAAAGFMPQILPQAKLQNANGMFSVSQNVASIAGPVIAGFLVAGVGAGWAISLDAASFIASAALLAAIPVAQIAAGAARVRERFGAELRAGFAAVRSRSWLWVSIASFSLFQFAWLGPVFVLGPEIADRRLGGAFAWGVIAAGFGVGAVVGSTLTLRIQPTRPLLASLLGISPSIPMLILLGFVPPVAVLAIAMALAGGAVAFCDTLWTTTLQTHVPKDLISRVAAWDWMGSSAFRPIGYAVAGPAAALLGTRGALFAFAGIVTIGTVTPIMFQSVRSLPRASAVEQ
jgi:MFS family permease